MNRTAATVAGAIACLVLWEAVGRARLLGDTLPPLSRVIAYLADPAHTRLLIDAIARTAGEAAAGLAIGSLVGIVLASIGAIVPPAAEGLAAFASLVNGIPVVAVAGVCVLTIPRETTPLVVAALAVGFVIFVGAAGGFGAASTAHRDLFAVCGASRRTTFARLLVPAALPSVVDALRSAAPLAVVGAIIGEWFSSERGLGPLLVAAMQNFAIAQLWAVALLCVLLSMACYGALGLLRARIAARFQA